MDNFPGFEPPESNFSRTPHALVEHLPLITSLGEMKVILYILRHTWGFQDNEKKITLDEFAKGRKRKDGTRLDPGTGLSIPTIRQGIKRAVGHGFIQVETDARDLGRIKHYYSLRMLGENNVESGCKNVLPTKQESCTRTEKETLERNLERNHGADAPPPSPEPEPVVESQKTETPVVTEKEPEPDEAPVTLPVTEKKTRKKSERDERMDALVMAFCELTSLPPPALNTDKQKRAAGALWFGPLAAIAKTCDNDAARARNLMAYVVAGMDDDELTISAPNSIKKMAIAEQARRKRTNGKPKNGVGQGRSANGQKATGSPPTISPEEGERLRASLRERRQERIANGEPPTHVPFMQRHGMAGARPPGGSS